MLTTSRFDVGLHRPYFVTNRRSRNYGERCVTLNTGRTRWDPDRKADVPVYQEYTLNQANNMGLQLPPVVNATSLRKEEWIQLDQTVLRAARYRLRYWADIAKANSFGGFNAMAKMILEYESMSDPGAAVVDMDGTSEGYGDSPKFQLEGLPLPITHADFELSARRLATSRNSGTPLDSTLGEASGRRVAESIEKTSIGVQTGVTFGGNSTQVGGYSRTSQVYGALTFPARLTKTNGYIPTGNGRAGSGWVQKDTLLDALAIVDQLRAQKFYGPFTVYTSNDWDQYLDADYILTGGNVATQTLRERLRRIDGLTDVKRLDFLFNSLTDRSSGGPGLEGVTSANPFTWIVQQNTPDVVQAVNGMDITNIQWQEKGGMQLFFKTLCIQVPRFRCDFYGNCGVLVATFTV